MILQGPAVQGEVIAIGFLHYRPGHQGADRCFGALWVCLGIIGLAGLVGVSRVNFLLFHTLAELFSIAVAWAVFFLVWNTRRIIENNALVFIGIAYLFVGFVDLLHTLAYKGMGVFSPDWGANLPTQLWILARAMESVALMLYAVFAGRRIRPIAVSFAWLGVTVLGLGSIFYLGVFPVCYMDGIGLTRFKIVGEYVICLVILAALAILYQKRSQVDRTVLTLVALSMMTTIGAELAFTFYIGVYDLSNLIGHLFKLLSFFLIYLALVRSGLSQPYSMLFDSLRRSQENYRSLFNNAPVGLFRVRVSDGRPLEVNGLCARLCGYPGVGECLADGDNPDGHVLKALHRDLLAALEEPSGVRHREVRIQRRDGEPLWVSVSAHTSSDSDTLQGALIDISDRKRVEEELKNAYTYLEQKVELRTRELEAAAHELESLFNASQVGMMVLRGGRFFEKGNQRLADILGYETPEAMKGISIRAMHLSEDNFRDFGDTYYNGLRQGELLHVEYELRQKDGSPVWCSLSGKALDPGCPPDLDKGVLWVIDDISERKRADETLRQTLRDLERSNEELAQFAYVASHDLQEPLRAIVGFLQLLEARYTAVLDDKGRQYIERAVNAGHRTQALISDLLTLSRVNTRGRPFEPADLTTLLDNVLERLGPRVQEKQARILKDRLPTLAVDAVQIQVLFRNLITNALKYNEASPPVIEIGCAETKGEFRFHVTDNGIGIDPKFHDRIFVVFQRLHGRQDYSGNGLGLTLCRKIVERHGGTIWVESEQGKGSTLFFTLPKERMAK